jgi:hypothetical protein
MYERQFLKTKSGMISAALAGVAFITPSYCGAQTASAPTVVDTAEAITIDAKMYAQLYGVSLPEAVRRISIMLDTSAEVATVEDGEGDDLAGSYFENSGPKFGLVIRSVKASRADGELRRKGRAEQRPDAATKAKRRVERRAIRQKFKLADSEVEEAEDVLGQDVVAPVRFSGGAQRSMKGLVSVLADADAKLKSVPGLQTVYPDQRTGELVLMVKGNTSDNAKAAAAQVLTIPFRIELIGDGFKEVAFRGGQRMWEEDLQPPPHIATET